MFILLYKLKENVNDAGYLCMEASSGRLVAFNKLKCLELASAGMLYGVKRNGNDLACVNGFTGINDVNKRAFGISKVKEYVRFKNGLCACKIMGVSIVGSQVMIRFSLRYSKPASTCAMRTTVMNMIDDIRASHGSYTETNGSNVIIKCNSEMWTKIMNSQECIIELDRPDVIRSSCAPSSWKQGCSSWITQYRQAVDMVLPEAKREPYNKVVSPMILFSESTFNGCKSMRDCLNVLGNKGMVRTR